MRRSASRLPLSLSLSLFPSLLASYPGSEAYIMSVMFVTGGDDNDSHVEYSHHAATALSWKRSRGAAAERSGERRYDGGGEGELRNGGGLGCVLLMGIRALRSLRPSTVALAFCHESQHPYAVLITVRKSQGWLTSFKMHFRVFSLFCFLQW